MKYFNKLVDFLPLRQLIILSIFLAILPFPLSGEPHIWEKLKMLVAGDLVKAVDIFDLFYHLSPTILLIAKIRRLKSEGNNGEDV